MFSLYGMGADTNISEAEAEQRAQIMQAAAGLPEFKRVAIAQAIANRNYQRAWAIIYDRSSAYNPTAQPTAADLAYNPFAGGGTPDITRPTSPDSSPTVIRSPSDIPEIIDAFASAYGTVMSARQQAQLQAQLLNAARTGQPVYLPSSSWATIGFVVGGLVLILGAVYLYRRKR